MGNTRWDDTTWKTYVVDTKLHTKTVEAIYVNKSLLNEFDPKNIKVRESRDSDLNPESTAIIIGLDVTGSMNPVLDVIVKESLKTLFEEIYDRKPVTDPHIMVCGIGDMIYDSSPFQATQFEADIKIVEQLQQIYFERGGGGNSFESYITAWLFAALRTSIDCFEKRGKKGYLFTIGDEEITPWVDPNHVNKFFGENTIFETMTAEALFEMASKQYEIFHLMIEQGSHMRFDNEGVVNSWTNVIGQRALRVSDHTKIAEIIISAIQVNEGADKKKIVASWDGSTAVAVDRALSGFDDLILRPDGKVVLF
jgi:hypothetical protein